MVFTSPLFLFGFLPIFLVLYALAPTRARNLFALAASFLFYAWGEPRFVVLVIASALFDLWVVRALDASRSERRRRGFLLAGVGSNLAILFFFKYASFAAGAAQALGAGVFGVALPPIGAVALPIGVSFVVFEKITYVVDVYRRVGRPARTPIDYLLYVFLFPKLLAGPIVKYHDLAEQLIDRPRRADDLLEGLTRFSFGLAKKLFLADPMGELADPVFGPGEGAIGFRLAWLGMIAFSLQIYFDFSGYSDMAIGLARTMGFRLMENFDRPYLAIGFADFWRRWHISLSTWIRDYLYLPLGGDRVPRARLYLNLWICFLASGLWHGAAWTFVVWGAYHGLFLTLDRMFLERWLRSLPPPSAIALTFLAVSLGWVVFRAPDFATAVAYYTALASPGALTSRVVVVTADLYWVMGLGLALCFLPAVPGVERWRRAVVGKEAWPMIASTGACALLVLSIGKAMTVAFHPFLYFRF